MSAPSSRGPPSASSPRPSKHDDRSLNPHLFPQGITREMTATMQDAMTVIGPVLEIVVSKITTATHATKEPTREYIARAIVRTDDPNTLFWKRCFVKLNPLLSQPRCSLCTTFL